MNHAVDRVIPFEIMLHGLDQFFHRKVLVVIYIILDRCKTVCNRTDTHALDIVRVVSCAAGIVIFGVGDTVVGHDRQARSRHLLSVQLLDHIIAADLDIYDICKLFFERVPKFVIGLEILRISKLKPDLLTGILIESIEQRQLEYLRDIQVSGQDISLAAPCAGLHTS